jgi:hypothetical protein
MLWMKNWMETRWWLLYCIGIFVAITALNYQTARLAPRPNPIPPLQRLAVVLNIYSLFWIFPAVVLAGAGVKTQAPFQRKKGLHGSTHFTLSLPVSRMRLFTARVGLGLLEMTVCLAVGCFSSWIALVRTFPELTFSITDMLAYGVTVLAVGSVFFSISTLLATVLDDIYQVWGSLIVIALLGFLSRVIPIPASLDIGRATGSASPLMTHQLPWSAIALSLGVAAVLCTIAARIVVRRDY